MHDGIVLLVCTVLCAGCYHIYYHVGIHFIPDHISAAPGCMTGRWGLLAIRAIRTFIHIMEYVASLSNCLGIMQDLLHFIFFTLLYRVSASLLHFTLPVFCVKANVARGEDIDEVGAISTLGKTALF